MILATAERNTLAMALGHAAGQWAVGLSRCAGRHPGRVPAHLFDVGRQARLVQTGGGWTGALLIADWDETERYAASDVHAKRFKFQEIGVITVRGDNFPCADELSRKRDMSSLDPSVTAN